MKTKKAVELAVGTAVSLAAAVPMAAAAAIYNKTFGVRVDDSDDCFGKLSAENAMLRREAVRFPSDKGQELQGYFYSCQSGGYMGLMVVAHGMGGGHDGYAAEIEYFAKNGYLVFAYDGTGTNESDGKKLVGLSQSPIDLSFALKYLDSLEEYKELPVVLFGHSWGGFAVAAVGNYTHMDIAAIVSVAGFERSENILRDNGKEIVGRSIGLFLPFAKLYERVLFGKNASNTGISGLAKTKAQVLIMHSRDDKIVSYEDNFLRYRGHFGGESRFEFWSMEDRGHAVMLKKEAFAKAQELSAEIKSTKKNDRQKLAELKEELAITDMQLDESIMRRILHFCNKAVADKALGL